MSAIEYLDPDIAGEGSSANNWQPGAWTNATPTDAEEYQPDIEPPHINDYAAFKKHKHYRQYFRPYRYQPFPAWMYHPTKDPVIAKSVEDVRRLGPEWSPTPNKPRVDMTGKSLPVKSETQKLAETVAAALAQRTGGGQTDIAAIVAAVVAAVKQTETPSDHHRSSADDSATMDVLPNALTGESSDDAEAERQALEQLAEERGIKVDGRWSNARLAKELGV